MSVTRRADNSILHVAPWCYSLEIGCFWNTPSSLSQESLSLANALSAQRPTRYNKLVPRNSVLNMVPMR